MIFFSCSLDGKILEKIFFKSYNSGSYSITLDLKRYSKVISLVERLENSENNFSEAVYNFFSNTAEKIKTIKGIKNTTLTYNEKLSSFILFFEFENIKALNAAISCVGEYLTTKEIISFKRGNHLRRILPNFANVISFLNKDNKSAEEKFGLKFFLKNFKVVFEYDFEKMKVRNPTSGFLKVSKNFQKVVYEDFLIDMTNENSMHNIFLKT